MTAATPPAPPATSDRRLANVCFVATTASSFSSSADGRSLTLGMLDFDMVDDAETNADVEKLRRVTAG